MVISLYLVFKIWLVQHDLEVVCNLLKIHEIQLACSYYLKVRLDRAHQLKGIWTDLVQHVVAKAQFPLFTNATAVTLDMLGGVNGLIYHLVNHRVRVLRRVGESPRKLN